MILQFGFYPGTIQKLNRELLPGFYWISRFPLLAAYISLRQTDVRMFVIEILEPFLNETSNDKSSVHY